MINEIIKTLHYSDLWELDGICTELYGDTKGVIFRNFIHSAKTMKFNQFRDIYAGFRRILPANTS